MKKFKLFFFTIFFQQITFGQTKVVEIENIESSNLKGKIKTIKEISFKANKINNEFVKTTKGWLYDWEKDQEYYFDSLGNLLLRKDIGNSSSNYSIKLDKKMRIIELHRLYKSEYYVYDSLNKIISSKLINKQPEVISKGNTKPTNGTISNYKYYYDSKKMLIKKEEFKSNSIISIETYKYDNQNNIIESVYKKGSYIEKHNYEFDSNNLLKKYEWSDNEEGTAEITTYKYLNNLKILEHWVDFEEGVPVGYIDDKFDNGNIIETTEVDADGTITLKELCKYEFDKKGNWIKKIIDYNGKYYIIEREIEYY
jgi:hypothetical protein